MTVDISAAPQTTTTSAQNQNGGHANGIKQKVTRKHLQDFCMLAKLYSQSSIFFQIRIKTDAVNRLSRSTRKCLSRFLADLV